MGNYRLVIKETAEKDLQNHRKTIDNYKFS